MRVIAVTGGIGCGKTIVSRIVSAMGYDIYDCDSRAKALMDKDEGIKHALCMQIHPEAVKGGVIDRNLIAKIVFADDEMLATINDIVHGAVRADLAMWLSVCKEAGKAVALVETAILYESGLDAMVDEVWNVEAPEKLRIARVMARNGIGRDEAALRVEAQKRSHVMKQHACVRHIVNDGLKPVLPQVEALLV